MVLILQDRINANLSGSLIRRIWKHMCTWAEGIYMGINCWILPNSLECLYLVMWENSAIFLLILKEEV